MNDHNHPERRNDPPIFRADVTLFILDDMGVVFSEAAQEIYELNTAATYIWCRLEEGAQHADIAEDLAKTFGFDQAAAQRYVDETLEQWAALGLIGQAAKPGPKERQKADHLDRQSRTLGEREALPQNGVHVARYDILGQRFRVGVATECLEDWVCPALAHLEVSDAPGDESVIEVCERGKEFLIFEDGRVQFRCAGLEEVMPNLLALMFTRAFQQTDFSVAFHAGAVSDGHLALVLPGTAGSGKTTLTAALVAAGFNYLSDDLILMRKDLQGIEGVPFSLCIKESGVDVLTTLFPKLRSLRTHLRADGKRVRYLPPPRSSLAGSRTKPIPAKWVVFPHYEAGQVTRLSKIERSEALRRLIAGCTLSRPLTRQQVGRFVGWLQDVSCYDFAVGPIEEAVATVKKLCADNDND